MSMLYLDVPIGYGDFKHLCTQLGYHSEESKNLSYLMYGASRNTHKIGVCILNEPDKFSS